MEACIISSKDIVFSARMLGFFQKVFRFSLEINTSNPRSGNQLLQSDLLIPQIEVT